MEWRMGGNQHAARTSGYSSLVESRQSADVAAQPKLGLLSEWGAGLGCNRAAGIAAAWESLKLSAHAGNYL
jgi:hypothetical protein